MDPELEAIITGALGPYLSTAPPPEALRQLIEQIHAHTSEENNRKNLVGEGFEDTLAAILGRIHGIAGALLHPPSVGAA